MTLVASVVMLIMQAVMTMMMPCARAAQQRHRAIEELLFGHRAVLVGIERIQQHLGTLCGT